MNCSPADAERPRSLKRNLMSALPSSFLPRPSLPHPQNESTCREGERQQDAITREQRPFHTGLSSMSSLSPVLSNKSRKERCCANLASRTSSITRMFTLYQSARCSLRRRPASSSAARELGSSRMPSASFGLSGMNLCAWKTVYDTMSSSCMCWSRDGRTVLCGRIHAAIPVDGVRREVREPVGTEGEQLLSSIVRGALIPTRSMACCCHRRVFWVLVPRLLQGVLSWSSSVSPR